MIVYPNGSLVKNPHAMKEMQESWVWSLSQENSLEEEMQPTPVFLPGKSNGQRNLAGYSPWDHKESDMSECEREKLENPCRGRKRNWHNTLLWYKNNQQDTNIWKITTSIS